MGATPANSNNVGAWSMFIPDLGKQINHGVMDSATYLPYLWDASLYYRNPRLTNVYLGQGLGSYYDYVNIGVSDGK